MPSIKSIASKAKKLKNVKDAKSLKGLLSSNLTKLKIVSYSDPEYGSELETYEVQFNPDQVEQKYSVDYNEASVNGAINGSNKFKHIKPAELNLKLTLDGTGVNHTKGTSTKMGMGGTNLDVPKEIEQFQKVCCNFQGESHDVPYLIISWGSLEFRGRLRDLKITHVLFKSSGEPVRSILDLTFVSAQALKEQSLEKKTSSPDLTHSRIVQVGDTLPLMCKSIYNDTSYYLKIARFNNIVDFRNLEPGTEIIFPPIV